MKILKAFFSGLYHIWFYILITLVTVILFPFLAFSILKKSWYPYFFKVARVWSKFIIYGMGCYPIIEREEKYKKGESYMFVANHTSMLDIMLMFYATKSPFVFVGKKELAKFPLFGFIYKRTCILVDRGNSKSRLEVFKRAQERLNQGLSVCIFPEGRVPDDKKLVLDKFKEGAFRLAIEHNIPIAPMTFYDNKTRLPYDWFSGKPGKMRAKIHKTIATSHLSLENKRELTSQTQQIILSELVKSNK